MMEWNRKNIYETLKEAWPNEHMSTYKEFCAGVFFQPGGKTLRLRSDGVKTLATCYTPHIVEVMDKTKTKKNMPSKHFVFLTRYCKGPYYIATHEIIFFDEDEAFIFKMCDGDIDNVKSVSD